MLAAQSHAENGVALRDSDARRMLLRLADGWAELAAGQGEADQQAAAAITRLLFLRLCEGRGLLPPGSLQRQIAVGDNRHLLPPPIRQPHTSAPSGHPLPPAPRAAARDLWAPEAAAIALLPPEALGWAYERLIAGPNGAGGRRRAGGSYYTPPHIVRYLVAGSVGALLDERPSADPPLRVVDPACGAGALLLGAYRLLLDHHLRWYQAHGPARREQQVRRAAGGGWELTPDERRRILSAGIHGVDLDPQAVEVARLSLWLAAQAPGAEPAGAGAHPVEAALDLLAGNVVCGNALVAPGTHGAPEAAGLTQAELEDLAALDWAAAFPQAAGGFDAVVGNPPYLNLKRRLLPDAARRYFRRTYAAAAGQYDAFALFVERGLALLAPGGALAFIAPKPLLASESYAPARAAILRHRLLAVADGGKPFADAAVESAVVIVRREPPGGDVRLERLAASGAEPIGTTPQASFARAPFQSMSYLLDSRAAAVVERMLARGAPLADQLALIARGAELGKRSAALRGAPSAGARPLLRGEDVGRYALRHAGLFIDPAAAGRDAWKDEGIYERPEKILVRRVADGLVAAHDAGRHWTLNTLYTLVPAPGVDARFLLACLNARPLTFYLRAVFLADDRLFPYVRISQLERLPIPRVGPDEHAIHDQLVQLVEQMLGLHQTLAGASAADAAAVRAQIATADRAIDRLVCGLYGLAEAEAELVAQRAPQAR